MELWLKNAAAGILWSLEVLLVIALLGSPFVLLLMVLFDDSHMWMDAYFTRQLPTITFFQ